MMTDTAKTATVDPYEARKVWRHDFIDRVLLLIVAALNKIDAWEWSVEAVKDQDDRYDRYRNPSVVNAAGERFWLMVNDADKRLTVHGQYGQNPDGRVWIPRDASNRENPLTDPSPSMDGTKAPELIARDIARRFLPDYRKCRAAYVAQMERHAAYRSDVEALTSAILTASAGKLFPDDRFRDERDRSAATERSISLYRVSGISYGTMRVGGSYVRLEASVSPEFAVRLAELIASLPAKQKGED